MSICTIQLPKKLSDCLDLALSDLELCETDPRYHISMSHWHSPNIQTGVCEVCLAGSVLTKTLGRDSKEIHGPYSVQLAVTLRLYALDWLRLGCIELALNEGRYSFPYGLPSRVSVTPYNDDPTAFKTDLKKIVDLLREYGL